MHIGYRAQKSNFTLLKVMFYSFDVKVLVHCLIRVLSLFNCQLLVVTYLAVQNSGNIYSAVYYSAFVILKKYLAK